MASAAQRQELQDKIKALAAKRFGGDFVAAFTHYDSNRDGKIDRTELLVVLGDAGIGNFITRGSWADGVIAELDLDKDGAISQTEFLAVLQ